MGSKALPNSGRFNCLLKVAGKTRRRGQHSMDTTVPTGGPTESHVLPKFRKTKLSGRRSRRSHHRTNSNNTGEGAGGEENRPAATNRATGIALANQRQEKRPGAPDPLSQSKAPNRTDHRPGGQGRTNTRGAGGNQNHRQAAKAARKPRHHVHTNVTITLTSSPPENPQTTASLQTSWMCGSERGDHCMWTQRCDKTSIDVKARPKGLPLGTWPSSMSILPRTRCTVPSLTLSLSLETC